MDEKPLGMYEMQFDIAERKMLIAEMLSELRRLKGYKQTDVAGYIGISPQTYNGYEKGRNEPPAEMIVRLAYLYGVPIDLIMQRDRLHKLNESADETMKRFEAEMEKVKEDLQNSKYRENIQLGDLIEAMQEVAKYTKMSIEKNGL